MDQIIDGLNNQDRRSGVRFHPGANNRRTDERIDEPKWSWMMTGCLIN